MFTKLIKLLGGGGVLNGKKTFGLNLVSIVALVWALVSPATAPTEQAIGEIVGQGQEVVAQGKEVLNMVREDVLPLVIVLVTNVLALFTGLHSQSKIGKLLGIVGTFLGRYVDLDDVARLDQQIKEGAAVAPPVAIKAIPIVAPR